MHFEAKLKMQTEDPGAPLAIGISAVTSKPPRSAKRSATSPTRAGFTLRLPASRAAAFPNSGASFLPTASRPHSAREVEAGRRRWPPSLPQPCPWSRRAWRALPELTAWQAAAQGVREPQRCGSARWLRPAASPAGLRSRQRLKLPTRAARATGPELPRPGPQWSMP